VRAKIILFVVLIAWILSACSLGAKDVPTPAVAITNTPLPTLTATPVLPLTILVLPPDLDKTTSDAYQKTVYELAQSAGMRFQVRNSLTPADLEPGLKIVIALPPDPGIAALAKAAPQVQFLAINIPGIQAGGNVSVLSPSGQVDVAAFIAGYTAAMISDEYRIGMIIPQGDANAQRAFYAFANGMAYYCGLCKSFYVYATSSPAYIQIPPTESKKNYLGYANALINQKIYTLFVYPDLADPAFLTQIGTTGEQIIGTSMPNPRPGGWVMTISPDETKAIQNAWPNLVAGKGGLNIQSPVGISDVDSSLLSPGKQRLVQQVVDDLASGRLTTGVGQ
jgi:hypothetical protein